MKQRPGQTSASKWRHAVRTITLSMYLLIAYIAGSISVSVTMHYVQAGTISASEVQQLKAKLNRVDRELANTRQRLADLARRYAHHTHGLNVELAAAPAVPSMAAQGPNVRLLFHAGGGNPTMTSGPQ